MNTATKWMLGVIALAFVLGHQPAKSQGYPAHVTAEPTIAVPGWRMNQADHNAWRSQQNGMHVGTMVPAGGYPPPVYRSNVSPVIGGHPVYMGDNMIRHGGQQYRCPALTTWLGRIAGGVLGWKIGEKIEFQKHHMNAAGTLIGVVAGQEIACEIFGQPERRVVQRPVHPNQRVIYQSQQSPFPSDGEEFQHPQQIPARRQGGHVTHVPSSCKIEGQVFLGMNEEQCAAKAQSMTRHGAPQVQHVASSSSATTSTSSQPNSCTSGKVWKRLNWFGHPQHEKHVCMAPDDPHVFPGE